MFLKELYVCLHIYTNIVKEKEKKEYIHIYMQVHAYAKINQTSSCFQV